MKKMSVTTALALLLTLIMGSTVVYAAIHWCPDDPALSIGGTTVNVIIEIPEGSEELVTGPVLVNVHVPSNVDTDVISYGEGFGQGETVEFIKDGEPVDPGDAIKVKVEVLVSATEKMPVKVTVEAPGLSKSKRGWSNEWVWCKARL